MYNDCGYKALVSHNVNKLPQILFIVGIPHEVIF